MPKYRFHVVGIRHHDYAGKLAELYQKAEGNSMSMHLEKDNVLEENAIIVFMADKFVGYVRTGLEREQAEELVRMNRLSVIGRVVEIDPEYRMITIEVDTDIVVKSTGRTRGNALRKWRYSGELLRSSEKMIGMKAMLDNLQMCVEQQRQWDETMSRYFDFIVKNLWLDASVETQQQLDTIEQLLTANSDIVEGYRNVAAKLQFVIVDANSPESRKRQVKHLQKLSQSKEMKQLINDLGDRAMEVAEKIPNALKKLFDSDPQEYVGRLRYLRCPYWQLHQLETLMAMRIALKSRDKHALVEFGDVINSDRITMKTLSAVIADCYQDSTKNLALIYCTLRDNNLLVNDRKYHLFVVFLVSNELIPWMNEKQIKSLSDSISQYMRSRKDHDKIREGYGKRYMDWNESKEKSLCEQIARYFVMPSEK